MSCPHGSECTRAICKLTHQRQTFVREYLKDKNAKQAAIRAGYSAKSAESRSSRLMAVAAIEASILEEMKWQTVRLELSADRVLTEAMRLAFTDPRSYFKDDGTMKEICDLDDDAAASLASIEIEELFDRVEGEKIHIGHVKKIKFWDKNSAIEKLMKHLGLIKDRHEHTGPNGGPITHDVSSLSDEQLAEARKLVESAVGLPDHR